MSKTCVVCGKRAYSDYCVQHKPQKAIKKISDKADELEKATKALWFELNPPDEDGHWECYLQIHPLCPVVLDRQTITQEHVKPKQRYPELKYVVSNRKPACELCNRLKSGQSLETLAETYPHLEKYLVDSV